jgi:hypothetical protein
VLAAQALDGLRGDAALPEADEPEAGDAAVGEQLQLFVGDLVEAVDVAAGTFWRAVRARRRCSWR